MRNNSEKLTRAAEEALILIAEMQLSYAKDLKKILDPGIGAVFEAMRMFHEGNGRKLKDYLEVLMNERPAGDG